MKKSASNNGKISNGKASNGRTRATITVTDAPPTLEMVAKEAGVSMATVSRIINGTAKVSAERKFFPGYVLVEMEMDDDTWHLVKNTNKVTGFVGGTATKPAPIPEKEVEAIMQQMREGVEKPKPKVLFEVGEMVRVKDGPFTDFQGTVEDVNYEKSRLQVAVQILGRSTPVELEFGQVEKAK